MSSTEDIKTPDIAIAGTAGVPSSYGGFETLADELVKYAENKRISQKFLVYCSGRNETVTDRYRGAVRRYISISANGAASIPYDIYSFLDAWWRGCKTLLVLGVSGAPMLFFLRMFSSMTIVTNVDGIEWKRDKWGQLARFYLRFAEWCAVRFSHQIIADNRGIQEYLARVYHIESEVISYGGDHALMGQKVDLPFQLPESYALALCRIEPENNCHLLLRAFSEIGRLPLVFVGNWDASEYGRELRKTYERDKNCFLLSPIYDQDLLYTLRARAKFYVHGHSAGGTNPSLVEMMHFAIPVAAFDCNFNRYTTEGKAFYFESSGDLLVLLNELLDGTDNVDRAILPDVGREMGKIAQARYVWSEVGKCYLDLLKARALD